MSIHRAALPFVTLVLLLAIRATSNGAAVTFNQDIAPLLHQHCAVCHRPGEAAPFSLLSYNDAVKKARTMARATEAHIMPPWKAEPASFPYRDERRLTAREIGLIQDWVKSGTPEGTGVDRGARPFVAGESPGGNQ